MRVNKGIEWGDDVALVFDGEPLLGRVTDIYIDENYDCEYRVRSYGEQRGDIQTNEVERVILSFAGAVPLGVRRSWLR
jgi:hypothetical protein